MKEAGLIEWIETAAFPWLVDVSLQVSLILVAALLAVWLGRRWLSAAKQHAILALGLFSVPLLTVASLWVPGWGLEEPAVSDEVRIRVSSTPAVNLPAIAPAPQATSPGAEPLVQSQSPLVLAERLKSFCLVLWASGFAVCALMVLASAWKLRRLRLAARPVRGGDRAKVMESLRAELGISEQRSLSLLISDQQSMPMTWGWRNAVILLPAASANWSEARLRLVLRHEMAHVARADSAISLGSFLCASLVWFHPLAWLCCHRLWRLREHACDDHVLTACDEDPVSYAEELVAAIKVMGPLRSPLHIPALAMAMGMAQPGKRVLRARIGAVLDDGRERSGFGHTMRRVALPLWLLSVVVLGGLSACRETPSDEPAIRDGWSRRIFVLTDQQWQRLSGGVNFFQQSGAVDPFAAEPLPPAKPPSIEQIKAASLAVRSQLIEDGVEFDFKTAEEATSAVTISDTRTLVVSGDDDVLNQVASVLIGYTNEPQIRIRAHAFRVPHDFKYAEVIEVMDGDAMAGTVTGIVDTDTARQLLARVEKIDGVEVVARPVVVTSNARAATIEVGREFIYPTEYDPPEIPNEMGTQNGSETSFFPVTPANPTAFEMRNIGLHMEFTPILQKDGRLSLDMHLEQINFEGFINYGSPIQAGVDDGETGTREAVILTENRIVMPVFSSAAYASKVVIQPEDWIVVGGMGESEDQDIEDVEIDPVTGIRKSAKYTATVKTMLFFLIQADLIE